ncbi:Uncharacterised protein [Mycobacteroides abscessus subsp. abscessus]|nr:Uncharacterised protein [Mycobacteroides abscessus subsp. abscessus]SHR18838.1 Uncharacterised protein [Mycobacteroides abscessus subsp. abscessus]SHS92230.1 Uncharacterised protein [Mycobacteroides abscessus subsp. abscessus]SHT30925.1 Uncharacterised protein [Mycobacteroides abscessus subsp. abscessus]SHT63566.1 Uncharacterised protein [Mycobacteroides abscessus subsp. abscessus]
MHPGVERRRHLTKQHVCGFGIQELGQSSGRGECVLGGPRRGQARRDRPHLPPGPGLADHIRMPRMFGQSIRPALERRTRWRQQDLLSTTQLGRGYGQVLQQNPPGNTVDGQVMNDQHQLAGGRHPQPAQHHAGRGVQPRPCRHQCLVRKNVHRVQAVRGVDGPRLGHRQRPPASAVVSGPQAQHAVPIEQGLQHDQDRRFRHSGRSLQHHRLIEFINRAFNSLQPAHDRGRHHRTDALVDHPIRAIGHPDHTGQPGHGLLHEDVTRSTYQTGSMGPPHHLDGRNTVTAQVEERVIDADTFQAEHLGVDPGQYLLYERGRGTVMIDVAVFRCGQGFFVELAVDRQRQCRQRDHRGRHHITRQALGKLSADPGRIGRAGDVTDQPFVARSILAGDHRRLLYPGRSGQRRVNFTELYAMAPDLDLLVGASGILQLSAGPPARQVAGAIHPLSRRADAERARHEPRSRQPGPAHISIAQSRTHHIELADHTGRHGTQRPVQHKEAHVRQR